MKPNKPEHCQECHTDLIIFKIVGFLDDANKEFEFCSQVCKDKFIDAHLMSAERRKLN